MAALLKTMVDAYHYLNNEVADPRTQDWLFIGSPWPVFTLTGIYLYFVQTYGPSWMENRPAFGLKRIMQIYNVAQILLSAYIFYKALTLAWFNNYTFACQPVDYSDNPESLEIARTVYLYFCVKVIDLLDTAFFVLRKKYNQISFLHVYHHAGMVIGSWISVKYLAGGHVTFLGLINSFVHVIMYGYYLATSMNFSRPWWKKYITQMQLIQFFMILVQFLPVIWKTDCAFPRWMAIVFVPQNIFMIVLFGEFYYKAYLKKSMPNREENGALKETNGRTKSD